MEEMFQFSPREEEEAKQLTAHLREVVGPSMHDGDIEKIINFLQETAQKGITRDVFGLHPVLTSLQTACIIVDEIGLRRDSVIATLLYGCLADDYDNIAKTFGDNVARIVHGLAKIQKLYEKNPVVESDNFRNLLLSFAEDMRVILIMIADRVNIMRQIRDTNNEEARHEVSEEASYLYAPLAHKLGLYTLKSELEDLSLKYLEHDIYYMIREKLNETKASRDAYITSFIEPLERRLEEAGLKFHIKGRTKSIHSIWQKMKKQKCGFEGIYDLFAIRVILDAPFEKEKQQCWQVYSIVTDMYQPNPRRLRDWLSVPKSNGYECLHITVLGPDKKWVEVQIRTERMDDIAEHGLAAHWRYKGIKGGGQMDEWLANIRSALEAGDNLQVMDQFRMSLQPEDVYVFSPRGDIFKFPAGATILDFAYRIHSKIGNTCTGGRINNKAVPMREKLHSGDTVEVVTQASQTPKRDWLNIATTTKAKSKIRLALKETQAKDSLYAKEMLERRFKNKKVDIEENIMGHLIKKMGFKEVSDFYKQIADGKLDPNDVIASYLDMRDHLQNNKDKEARPAEEFNFENRDEEMLRDNEDVLTIDQNLKGIDYQLAPCCNPIYGDAIFGFVTVSGGIKIHRCDCPNAVEMRRRFGYRIVKARWSGKGQSKYAITLRIIGNDDIGVVSNITNIISKDEKIVMRSINIDSHDGLFSGNLTIQIEDTARLQALIKKLRGVKGVKQIERI
ncbi:MAG: bifunctional (p)ppGpp synthetase/guanosine-3',5'-bis(diphosphate) 3'-pyrophosphohydrolase [Prevotellaceae bacterium]|nr:bifunctional (p)ppGpp synthetase/guanosine-3',5'-bis(diphosphate) 3'-pyrophosphohydrolase [Prevotellaceae bacterium]